MVTNLRSPISDRSNLTPVRKVGSKTLRTPRTLTGMVVSTLLALVVLVAVLRYLPARSTTALAQSGAVPVEAISGDLQFGSLQMSHDFAGEALYLDGVVKNTGILPVTGATVEVDFHDAQGKVVSSVQKPIVGMAHEGTDLVGNEFARNPIQPNEMRFFRVAIEQAPPGWNQEVPELKVVTVKEQ